MKLTVIAPGGALSVLLAGCIPQTAPPPQAQTSVDAARIVDAIKTDEVHWNEDWKSGDASRVAAHYAPGATVMLPGQAPVVGGAAIKGGIAEAMNDGALTVSFASDRVEVARSGDLAVTHGAYAQTATDPTTKAVLTRKGSYVTVYKPQGGGVWKAVWDILTPGSEPAAAPIPK